MKKIISLSLVIVACLTLCGCGCSNKSKKASTKCSLESNQKDYKLETTHKIYSNKDIVTKVESKTTITSSNKEKLEQFEKDLSSQYKLLNTTYGGYDYNVKISGDKLEAKITVDYTKYDMKKFVDNNIAMKDFVNDKNEFTLELAKKYYLSTGAKCE